MIRWWPLAALCALTALGLAVGSGTTPLDDRVFALGDAYPELRWLLFFTDPRVLLAAGLITMAAAVVRRRWRLAAVVAVAPVLAVVAARVAKRLFDRYRDDSLAYPSGHTTLAAVVIGLALLVFGVTVWRLVAAAAVVVLAVVGQAVTYHYFTDTVGALFLASALLCFAAVAAGLDRCQPRCDIDHSHG